MRTKKEIVSACNELYNSNEYVVVIDYKGMNAEDNHNFRMKLRTQCDTRFLVVKNTLNSKSAESSKYENCIQCKGQCGVIFCNDLLKVSKIVNDLCFKDNKAKFVSCYNNGSVISEEEFKEIANLPSIENLRARFLYTLNAVQSSFARILSEKLKKDI